jgi:hypothetical protein
LVYKCNVGKNKNKDVVFVTKMKKLLASVIATENENFFKYIKCLLWLSTSNVDLRVRYFNAHELKYLSQIGGDISKPKECIRLLLLSFSVCFSEETFNCSTDDELLTIVKKLVKHYESYHLI